MRLVLILGGMFLGLYTLGRWSLRAGPARTAQTLRWCAVIVAVVLLLLLAARGGAGLAVPLLTLLVPLLLRWRALWRRPVPFEAERDGGAHSDVETPFLRMSLHHASGQLRGHVLRGRFAGRELGTMSLEELLALWRECRTDAQSAAVLEAYLDRTQREDWRDQARRSEASGANARPDAPISREEAYAILGLRPGASREEIKAAHRRLMQRVHPDHGGSTYLAARINQAKDCLLGH